MGTNQMREDKTWRCSAEERSQKALLTRPKASSLLISRTRLNEMLKRKIAISNTRQPLLRANILTVNSQQQRQSRRNRDNLQQCTT